MTERDPDKHITTRAGRKALIDPQWTEIQPAAVRELRAQLRSEEAAREAVQDAYLELMNSDEVQPGVNLLELVCIFAKRIATRGRVQRQRRFGLLRRHWQDWERSLKQTLTPDRLHALQEHLASVDRILLEFPAETRDIFKAHIAGEPRSEIAARLRIEPHRVYRLVVEVHTRILEVLPMPGEREP